MDTDNTIEVPDHLAARISDRFAVACMLSATNPGAACAALRIAKRYRGLGNLRTGGDESSPTVLAMAIKLLAPVAAIDALLENGADPHLADALGYPIHHACGIGNHDAVIAMLKRSPDCVYLLDSLGRTPREMAIACGRLAVAKLIDDLTGI